MTHTDWRQLTKAELDKAYDQAQHAPNRLAVLAQCARLSELARSRVPLPQRLAYGDTPEQALDWYGADLVDAPLVFFVHGGAWRTGRAQDYALCVDWLRELGVQTVVPDFAAVTDCAGRLQTLAEQVQRALAFTLKQAPRMGVDLRRIFLVGHSSGAHLAACMPTRDWHALGLGALPWRGLLCCSGMYELEPVSLSARSQYVAFTDEVVHELSPERHLDAFQMPVRLLCGSAESPEFRRQMDHFAQALQAHGAQVSAQWGEGLNHFEILQTMGDKNGFMAQALREMLTTDPIQS